MLLLFLKPPDHEKAGKGEIFICYDDGKPSRLASRERTMTPTQMVGTYDVYLADGEAEWSDLEWERIHRIQRMMLFFMSRARLNAEVERLTFYDDDGYRNMKYFTARVSRLAQEGGLGRKAAAQFNIRHMASVNQQIGRAAGNVLMRNYVRQIEEKIGDSGFVCRLGGDNYILLCGAECVPDLVEIFKGSATVYDKNTEERLLVSATAGLFILPVDSEICEADDILSRVFAAYESARNGGQDEIIFSSEELAEERNRVLRIQRLFPNALKDEEFLVYYQPKINVDRNELSGAEALCRWWHDGKIIPPMDFIPVLERNLDICKLDFYMLDHVCRDIRRWLDEGRRVVRVSVNLSRKHMVDADLFRNIVEIIDRNNVPHQYIEIELTETTSDVEFRDLKRVVNGLQDEGIFTSVDDFGIGYSSLKLLKDIPWNVLKVDKSFLPGDDSDTDQKNSILFKYVIAMAHELGLECIAEGVETKEQVAVLKDNYCNFAQGFYYDKPLPVETYEQRLLHHEYLMN